MSITSYEFYQRKNPIPYIFNKNYIMKNNIFISNDSEDSDDDIFSIHNITMNDNRLKRKIFRKFEFEPLYNYTFNISSERTIFETTFLIGLFMK